MSSSLAHTPCSTTWRSIAALREQTFHSVRTPCEVGRRRGKWRNEGDDVE